MSDRIARGISVIFHPILIPLYILLFLLNQNIFYSFQVSFRSKLVLSGVVVLTTIVLPLLMTWVFYKLRLISSILMKTREERIYPLLVVAIFYYMTYFVLKNFPVSLLFSYYMLGSSFLVILALIISFWMKISLHMIGIGGFLGVFLGLALKLSIDLSGLILPVILICGLVGTARLNENSHKSSEVYTGFLAGVSVMLCLLLLV
jgi:hypothetical protein